MLLLANRLEELWKKKHMVDQGEGKTLQEVLAAVDVATWVGYTLLATV